MSDMPQIRALTLATLPAKTRHQFDQALADVHQDLLDEIEAHENRQGPGPQLKTSAGAIEFEVTLRVKIAAVLDSDSVSQVSISATVDRKHPGFKAHKSGAFMRKTGFYVESDEGAEVLPFGRAQSRVP